MSLIYSHTGTCIYLQTHIPFFFFPVVIPRHGFLELELPEEIIIALQAASPTGTIFPDEQELEVNLDNDSLIPFFE